MFRWLKLPWDPYVVELPLVKRHSEDKVVCPELVGMTLPTDLICEMHKMDVFHLTMYGPEGHSSLQAYWASEDPAWLRRTHHTQGHSGRYPVEHGCPGSRHPSGA